MTVCNYLHDLPVLGCGTISGSFNTTYQCQDVVKYQDYLTRATSVRLRYNIRIT